MITMITTIPLLVDKCVNFNDFLFHIYITGGFDMDRTSFDEFLTIVTNRIWEYLPECFSDARFELSTVAKNNDFVLTGLVIRSNTSNTSPVIYLDQYYEAYMDGRDIEDILCDCPGKA